jgi:hypothetical protein
MCKMIWKIDEMRNGVMDDCTDTMCVLINLGGSATHH